MNTRNHEHYTDKTAHDAIKAADRLQERGDWVEKVSLD